MTFTEYIMGWNVAALVCLLVGLALVSIEMFIPGIGVPGILGAISLIAAVVLRANSVLSALITLVIVLVFIGVAAFVVLRSLKKGKLQKTPLVLHESINSGSTELSQDDMRSLIGFQGVCLNTLRPSGNAEIAGKKLDVVSEGAFIKKGASIKVVRVEGVRILVKEV
ncbi:MAG: NfeD family protein [Clostridia bacterium]